MYIHMCSSLNFTVVHLNLVPPVRVACPCDCEVSRLDCTAEDVSRRTLDEKCFSGQSGNVTQVGRGRREGGGRGGGGTGGGGRREG